MSPVTFERFVETHRRTLPGRIDRSVMANLSGGDQTKIISALHFMGLTDPRTDVPTTLFARMKDAGDDEGAMKAAWGDVLREAYPTAFTPPLSLATATQAQLNECFTGAYGIQGDSVRKATAFFIALARSAGIPLSGYFKQTRARTGPKLGVTRVARERRPAAGSATANARRDRKAQEPDGADGAVVAATWSLSNGGTATLRVSGEVFGLPKIERDALLLIADWINNKGVRPPGDPQTATPPGAAES